MNEKSRGPRKVEHFEEWMPGNNSRTPTVQEQRGQPYGLPGSTVSESNTGNGRLKAGGLVKKVRHSNTSYFRNNCLTLTLDNHRENKQFKPPYHFLLHPRRCRRATYSGNVHTAWYHESRVASASFPLLRISSTSQGHKRTERPAKDCVSCLTV